MFGGGDNIKPALENFLPEQTMSLLEVRKKFVQFSGRYDLVQDTTNWVDSGANWFIQAGQRYLDRMLDVDKHVARFFTTIQAGKHSLQIPLARVIYQVFLVKDSGEAIELCLIQPSEMQRIWSASASERVPTTPRSYTPLVIRIGEQSDFDTIPGLYANVSYEAYEYKGITFGVISDKDYGIDVKGLFYSQPLTADNSQSLWTEVHDDILVQASLMTLERFYRNFDGLKESKASVDDLIRQLDMDAVAQQIVTITKLEG